MTATSSIRSRPTLPISIMKQSSSIPAIMMIWSIAKTAVRDRAEKDEKIKREENFSAQRICCSLWRRNTSKPSAIEIREIDRLQPQELKKSNIQRPYIRFIPTEKAPGKIVLKSTKFQQKL